MAVEILIPSVTKASAAMVLNIRLNISLSFMEKDFTYHLKIENSQKIKYNLKFPQINSAWQWLMFHDWRLSLV